MARKVKKKYIISTLILSLLCMNKTYAACTQEEINAFKKIEDDLYKVENGVTDRVLILDELEVRFLRAFVVIRNGAFHDQRKNAFLLSQYIRILRKRRKSIWLAQREGRAKDGNDVTQPGVLKMLTIDSKNFLESIIELNICPVSISYEYDPCDYLKAREMQLKRDNPDWKKSREDDIESMSVGMKGRKGKVVYRLTTSINPEIDKAIAANPELLNMSKNEQIQFVCNLIDQHIHAAYEMYERGEKFDQYIEGQLAKINIPNKDENFLREKLYEMYDNQVKNYEKAKGL